MLGAFGKASGGGKGVVQGSGASASGGFKHRLDWHCRPPRVRDLKQWKTEDQAPRAKANESKVQAGGAREKIQRPQAMP